MAQQNDAKIFAYRVYGRAYKALAQMSRGAFSNKTLTEVEQGIQTLIASSAGQIKFRVLRKELRNVLKAVGPITTRSSDRHVDRVERIMHLHSSVCAEIKNPIRRSIET